MAKKGRTVVLSVFMLLVFLNTEVWAEGNRVTPSPVERLGASKGKPAKSGLRIGLRICGGMSFFDGGDINDSKANVTLNEYLAGLEGISYSIDENALDRSFEGGADLLFFLGKQFGLSLGASYLGGKCSNRIVIDLPVTPPATYTITFDPAVSAVPLTLGLFFSKPLGRRFDLLAEAGGGWTFARLEIDQKFIGSLGSMQFNAEGKAGGPCFYAKLGLEAAIARHFFFFIEILGRYAKISGFAGSAEIFQNDTRVASGGGRFYTYDLNVDGHPVRFIDFDDEQPSAASISNVGETRIDFSGVSARCGLRIGF